MRPQNTQIRIVAFICLIRKVFVKLLTTKIVPSFYTVWFLQSPGRWEEFVLQIQSCPDGNVPIKVQSLSYQDKIVSVDLQKPLECLSLMAEESGIKSEYDSDSYV